MFKLVIQDDEGKTTVVPLIRDEITIGRKEGNTIRLTERNVSRRHARILRNNGEVQIEDLGSYNGIRVNNARIAERVALRVSDQVQIGDYKLYLKAEGVEQVDDARTMPIERIDTSVRDTAATEAMAAVTANGTGTPTMPMGIPQTTGNGAAVPAAASTVSGLASAQLIGNPNRTMVAIGDTDPAGRPVATAATVAALTAPVGYGKLVVLSSNFASKEFELSRPQMIIGRTDENDIVINHRSISRNHAKLVREPETGRYTISDLQSSNGVRVNGQDYGKVELRRGDVVDLGHVRLRFVEADEDFVFARDAVITDVPDVGGKKGLLVAVICGVVLLGGIGVFFAMKGGGSGETGTKAGSSEDVVKPAGSGTNGVLEGSNDSVEVVAVGSGGSADPAQIEPDGPPTTNTTGSNAVPTTNNAADLSLECKKLSVDRKWTDTIACSERLSAADPARAKEVKAKAVTEMKADTAKRNLDAALGSKNIGKARSELDKIPRDSVYRADADEQFGSVVSKLENEYFERARAATTEKGCKAIQREASQKGVGEKAGTHRCPVESTSVAVKNPNPTTNPNPGIGSNTAAVKPDKPDKPDCDADALRMKGDDYLSTGMDAAALVAFEKSMLCRPDLALVKKSYMASCKSRNVTKAKQYFSRIPAAQQNSVSQICIRLGIQVP